jgi:hypothetical protein
MPTMIDASSGRPFCDIHARGRSAAYGTLVDGYKEIRAVYADWVKDGTMTAEDARICYEAWDGEMG